MSNSNLKVKIFTSYFQPWDIIENDIITPIQCGKSTSDITLPMIGDDTGDNISDKNYMYNELTAQYWVWKNDSDYDYIGFMHYRRHFNFSDEHLETNYKTYMRTGHEFINGNIKQVYHTHYIDDEYKKNISINNIVNRLDNADIILTNEVSFKPNVFKHYEAHHEIQDFYIIEDIIKTKYPKYVKNYLDLLQEKALSSCNIFIMKKELFNEYSEFLFTILNEFEIRVDLSKRNLYQARACGYIAERLLAVFIKHHKNKHIKYLQSTFINNSLVMNYNYNEMISNDEKAINIALCFNLNYLPHNCVVIKSIMDNANPNDQYNIYCLTRGLHNDCKVNKYNINILDALTNLEKNFPNLKVIYIDITNYKLPSFIIPSVAHYTIDTFSRFFLPDVLPNVKKIIYLDGDVVVCDDLRKLYNINITNLYAGVVSDLMMRALLKLDILIKIDKQDCSLQKYVKDNNFNIDTYFNGGVLLLNLEYIRENKIQLKWFELIKKYHLFVDQDILNVSFEYKIKTIDARWNIWGGTSEKQYPFKENLSIKNYQMWINALKNPGIIHYAGHRKIYDELQPFNMVGSYWWKVAKTTIFYEYFINQCMAKSYKLNIHIFLKNYLLTKHPSISRFLKPPYRILRKVYHMLRLSR